VSLALRPQATSAELAAAAERARNAAGRHLRLTLQLVGLAGRLPDWLQDGGLDADVLAAAGAVGMLTGDTAQMADTLLALRATLGIDEFVVPVDLAEFFVPVISRLAAAG
jgi:hypothetical protein